MQLVVNKFRHVPRQLHFLAVGLVYVGGGYPQLRFGSRILCDVFSDGNSDGIMEDIIITARVRADTWSLIPTMHPFRMQINLQRYFYLLVLTIMRFLLLYRQSRS